MKMRTEDPIGPRIQLDKLNCNLPLRDQLFTIQLIA
jgi:hypothetical protein